MLSQALAGLALFFTLANHPADVARLGIQALPHSPAAAAAATVSITGTVVESNFGTVLFQGNFVYVGHLRVQVQGAATFSVIYLCQGGNDPDCAPSQIPATRQVRIGGSLTTDTDGRPLILLGAADVL